MLRSLALSVFLAAQAALCQTFAITHTTVVDVERGTLARDQTIMVADGRIRSVGPAVSARIARNTRVYDARGTYVIPGLWDMHAHLGGTGRTSFALYLANGVTGVRDMGSDRTILRPWRDSINAGTLPGPRLFLAGPIVEREGWLNSVRGMALKTGDSAMISDMAQRIPISTIENAQHAVDSVITLGGDFLKIRNDATPAVTFAMLHHARERGLAVAGHWPERISPAEASDSGYRSLEHGPLTVKNGTLVPTLDQLSADERRALYAKFVRNRTAFTPTMISLHGYRLTPESVQVRILADSLGREYPRMKYIAAPVLASWKSDVALMKQETGAPLDWASFAKSWNRDVHDMANAGVLLLAGTDAGSSFVFTGFALADELELMVNEGGLSPLQALQTATLNVAKWMSATNDFGSVKTGMRADLVVLNDNPLTNIANVRAINAVVAGGKLLDRKALDGLLGSTARQ